MGDGSTSGSYLPVRVQGLTQVKAISGNGSLTECALLRDGSIRCWGANNAGVLGNGSHVTNSSTPVAVKGIHNAVSVTTGGSTACAVLATGHVMCWGADADGQLGNGDVTKGPHYVPVEVKGLSTARRVVTSGATTCAVLATAQMECWGGGAFGERGDGTKKYVVSRPVAVKQLTRASAASIGTISTCAALTDGTARCWGDNRAGELGTGGRNSGTTIPVQVKNL
jgi:alpha-tubulin suppressor-like RCC1 family protein